jgi:hypothetical protein
MSKSQIVGGILGALVLMGSVVPALPLDITIQNDGQVSGTGWYGSHENNETEPGTQTGQRWDLENIILEGNSLTIRGGFDYLNGVSVGSRTIRRGDVFIDVNGDALTTWTTASGPKTLNSTFNYDFAIHFDIIDNTQLKYQIVNLNSGSTFDVVTDIHASNPWRLSDGSAIDSSSGMGVAGLTSYTDGEGQHWDMTVDLGLGGYNELLAAMSGASSTLFHYSMECGNDVIMGSVSVPDGGTTLVLLGVALSGLSMVGRRIRSKA